METNLTAIVESSGLEKTKADFILEKFQGYFKIASEWEIKAKTIVVTSADQTDDMKKARDARLLLKEKRVEIEKARKNLKEQSLREGKAIDGIANVLKGLIEPTEEYLQRQENFVYIQEQKRMEALKRERSEILTALGMDVSIYDLANMTDAQFNSVVEGQKALQEKQQQEERERIEREKKEKEEQEKLRADNERLRLEAQKREREIAKEKALQEEELRKERIAKESEIRKEREAKERIEAEMKKKIEAEEKEKREKLAAEEKERKEKIAAEKKARRAPDKTKLLDLALRIDSLELPTVTSEETLAILEDVETLLNKVSKFIRQKVETL